MLDSFAVLMPPGLRRFVQLRKPERRTTLYLPQYAHLSRPYEHVIRHTDGAVCAMFAVAGAASEDLDDCGLAGLHERLCSLYRALSMRSQLTITTYLVRTEAEDGDVPCFLASNELAQRIDAGYRRRLIAEGRLWHNLLFLGVLIRPAAPFETAEPGSALADVAAEDLRDLEAALGTIEADLGADYGLRRLGLRSEGRLLFSEIAEALALVLSGRRRKVPLCRGRLGRSICAHRPVFHKHSTIELRSPGRSDWVAMFGFSVYPAGTDAAMFDHLLATPYRLVLAQSFSPMRLHSAQALVSRQTNRFISANDPARTQKEELEQAADELQQRAYALGIHNISLAVFADSAEALEKAARCADDDMRASGAIVSQIDFDIEAAYFGMLPGTEGLHCRAAPIKTRNFAAFAPMHNFPRGWRNGRWCDHVALFTTNGGTPYFWNPHVDSEGEPGESPHLLLTGPNRSGKTTLLLILLANVIARAGATVTLWDKDRGCKLAVMRMGGRYFEFKIGEDSGLAPLKTLDGSDPHDMDFLAQLVRSLIVADKGPPLVHEDERRIALGLRIIMAMPPHLRSFSELRAFLGVGENAAAERLRRWCAGNELGWVLDNPEDRISLAGSIVGFDQTHYLDHPLACGPIQAYLFHRVGKLADGRALVLAVDEFWKSLRNAAFASLVFDGLKTFPKKNAALWLSTQSVADPLRIPDIAHTVREQCLTHMHFPNGSAVWEGEYGPNGLGLSERAFEWIKSGLVGGGRGRFLLKQGTRHVPLQLSVEGDHLEEVRAELAGRTETVKLMDELIAELGDLECDALFREFHARRKSPAFQRKLRRAEAAEMESAA